MFRWKNLLLALALVAFVVGVHGRAVDSLVTRYEGGHRGACAAFFSLLAKNHLRYGLLGTGGVPVANPLSVPLEHLNYYMHHPPGAVLLAAVGASLGGSNPIGLRLVFLPFAIGIVVLAARLTRRRRPFERAAALGVAALAPAGVYYGAFVNFEVPTLFFVMLACHLYQRHLRRARRGRRAAKKDLWRAALATAAAVACDWIALGLPLVLLVLAPLRPRPAGPAAARAAPVRVALLLCAAALAVVVLVQAQYRLQDARYGFAIDAPPGADAGAGSYLLAATPFAEGFSAAHWATAVGGHLRTLYGLPLLIAGGAGLALALARILRRRGGDTEHAAAVLLAIGVANVVILANHSIGHDYYVLYLLPSLAIGTGVFAHAVVGHRPAGRAWRVPVCTALLAALFLQLGLAAHRELRDRRQYVLAELGERIAAVTPPDAVILLPHPFTLQLVAQADRYVESAGNGQHVPFAIARARNFGMSGRPLIFLTWTDAVPQLAPEVRALLDTQAMPREEGGFTIWECGPLPRG